MLRYIKCIQPLTIYTSGDDSSLPGSLFSFCVQFTNIGYKDYNLAVLERSW